MPTNPNMVAIQTVTVGAGGASSISFTSIPQTYTDLYVVISARCDESSIAFGQLYVAPNNATTNLSSKLLYGYGSGTGSAGYTTFDSVWTYIASDGATASTFGNASFYFPNYTSSNNKSISIDGVNENNATDARQGLTAGLWSSSSAITSLYFYVLGNAGASRNFKQYTTATLYGVTSAGYGAKATGGIITQDADYFYHTFLASGTFTPTSNLSCDYLVVAGGGGGGARYGGGGGGGGLLYGTGFSVTTSTNYTVTVGAGGSGGADSTTADGTQGSNSVFSTNTAIGGGFGSGTNNDAGAGGNGGSGGGGVIADGVQQNGGTATSGQGYAGGKSTSGGAPNYGSGGGGGAGAVGADGTTTTGGNGGAGATYSISGSSVTYAGGGGGGTYQGGTAGTGGSGGGGNAGTAGGNNPGQNGTVNRGGGGGGASHQSTNPAGGAGGSGIVIVRYAK